MKIIKDLRREIFHYGIYSSTDLENRLNQLENTLDDLIWDKLGFKHEGKAKRYLEEMT